MPYCPTHEQLESIGANKLQSYGIKGLRAKIKNSVAEGSPLIGDLSFVFTDNTLSPQLGSYKEDPPTRLHKLSTAEPLRKISISVYY